MNHRLTASFKYWKIKMKTDNKRYNPALPSGRMNGKRFLGHTSAHSLLTAFPVAKLRSWRIQQTKQGYTSLLLQNQQQASTKISAYINFRVFYCFCAANPCQNNFVPGNWKSLKLCTSDSMTSFKKAFFPILLQSCQQRQSWISPEYNNHYVTAESDK